MKSEIQSAITKEQVKNGPMTYVLKCQRYSMIFIQWLTGITNAIYNAGNISNNPAVTTSSASKAARCNRMRAALYYQSVESGLTITVRRIKRIARPDT